MKNSLKTIISVFAVICITLPANAGYPAGYYDSLEGKCGAELMAAVKAVVRDHTAISYSDGTWRAFLDTDVKTENGIDYWWDMYSNEMVKVSSGHPGMNVEHSVANSWWGGTKNDAYKDIVHLNPSNADANSHKSNYPLAELSSVTWDNGVTFVGRPKSGQGGGAQYCYEPADQYKGDFARVFMYMFTVYDDINWSSSWDWMYDKSRKTMFKDWAQDLLLRWNAGDPVSDKELKRNDGIYKNQKNRNPFIDFPSLADHIWGSKSNVPFSLTGTSEPEDPKEPDTPDNPDAKEVSYLWLGENDADMGNWSVDNVQLPSSSSYVWIWDKYQGKSYLKASAYIAGRNNAAVSYAWSPSVEMGNIEKATVTFEHAAKFQTTLKDLCKFVVKDESDGSVSEERIAAWPTANSWNFSSAGEIDLKKYSGKTVRIGFKYESSEAGADTWEVKNVRLDIRRQNSDVKTVLGYEEDDSFLVEVWGNNILAPEGAHIYDVNGRERDGENLQPGIYIVVKPTFKKAVKILLR